jgi:hypothetical protein
VFCVDFQPVGFRIVGALAVSMIATGPASYAIKAAKAQPAVTKPMASDHGVSASTAQPQRESTTRVPKLMDNRPSGPYCGINSLFACLSALGIDTESADLISVDYVGSQAGSSAKELIRAAERFGAEAKCVSHMTCNELQEAAAPMILHTRSMAGRDYDHWVAFLGMEDDRVRICDFPNSLQPAFRKSGL